MSDEHFEVVVEEDQAAHQFPSRPRKTGHSPIGIATRPGDLPFALCSAVRRVMPSHAPETTPPFAIPERC
jgi:hypothetical protein